MTEEKETVEGIILVFSCQKYLNSRLSKFQLPKDNYLGWKVIYVIGNLFLTENYVLDNNKLVIKCEDSYIHLLKKVVLGIEIVNAHFNIKQGILRSGDDLVYYEENLMKFLQGPKEDYMGIIASNHFSYEDKTKIKKHNDFFMINYYMNHRKDFQNPYHNLNFELIRNSFERPSIPYISGVLMYLSKNACEIIIAHMKKINYNVFAYDTNTSSYPYTIEDCGIGYILYINDIKMTPYPFYSNVYNEDFKVALHTNLHK
jgi:hypothetical protein